MKGIFWRVIVGKNEIRLFVGFAFGIDPYNAPKMPLIRVLQSFLFIVNVCGAGKGVVSWDGYAFMVALFDRAYFFTHFKNPDFFQ